MAEVNDFFMRSLRDSARIRPLTSGKITTARTATSSSSTYIINQCQASKVRNSAPPDLLANLLPSRLQHSETQSGKLKSAEPEKDPRSTVGTSVALTSKKHFSFNTKRESTPVKEYQSPGRPVTDCSLQRSHSTAIPHPALTSQVRVIPSWFPPVNIQRLQRQGSFHGETAASRYLKAKNQHMASSAKSERWSSSRKSSSPPISSSSSDTPTILEESIEAANETGSRKKEKGRGFPETRYVAISSPPLCPRHIKHHNLASLHLPKSTSFSGLKTPPSVGLKKEKPVSSKDDSQKSVFKFGTLPRSFKISNSCNSPRNTSSYSVFNYPENSDTKNLVSMPSYGKSSLRSRRRTCRNSWHMTSPVERPDVALPVDQQVWLEPLVTPPEEKLCTCGDTRQHVHLVKISDDLTLTDTRYFVEDSATHSVTVEQPQSDKKPAGSVIPGLNNLVTDESNYWKEGILQSNSLNSAPVSPEFYKTIQTQNNVKTFKPSTIKLISNAKEPENLEKESVFGKSINQLEFHYNVKRSRMLSVGTSSVLRYSKLTFDGFQDCSPLLRFPFRAKTYSMENIFASNIYPGQVASKAAFDFFSVRDMKTSASWHRTNNLSYVELLKTSGKLWQPSRSGSLDQDRQFADAAYEFNV